MNRKMIGRIATLSLMLGVSTIACTPGSQTHVAALSEAPSAPGKAAARDADRARALLAQKKGPAAVEAAEKAVAAAPENAAYRELLGQAYLSAGRFASAEASFRDSLSLSPDQPKTQFRLALAQIAEGRGKDAQEGLKALDGHVPAADLGLALAMAGDRGTGIAMLTNLVRSGKSDARGRQNLALAMALDGRWREARAIAMQDTAPDRIEAQLQGWAALAQPQTGGLSQVSAMLGVKPASDPGMPTMLALAPRTPAVPGAAPATAFAAADPAPQAPVAKGFEVASAAPVAPAAPAAPVVQTAVAAAPATPFGTPAAAMAPAAPVQVASSDLAPSVTVPLAAPASVKAMPADAPAAAVVMAAQSAAQKSAPSSTPAVTPVLLRAAPSAPLLRAPKAPIRQAVLIARPAATAFRQAGYVVQLGAFKRAGAIQAAWSRASKMMPRLTTYSPVHAQFSFSGNALVRLSVGGFTKHEDATALCTQIRAKGGQCFVRAVAGDAPVQWVRAETGQRAG